MRFLVFGCVFSVALSSHGQGLTVSKETDPAALRTAIMPDGLLGISNVVVSLEGQLGVVSFAEPIGSFTTTGVANTYELTRGGIVLSTGNAADYSSGPNFSLGNATFYNPSSALTTNHLYWLFSFFEDVVYDNGFFDASSVKIDFDSCATQTVTIEFVVGSDEYPEFVMPGDDPFADVFIAILNFNGQTFENDGAAAIVVEAAPAFEAVTGTELDGIAVVNPVSPANNLFSLSFELRPGDNELVFVVADEGDNDVDTTVYIQSIQVSGLAVDIDNNGLLDMSDIDAYLAAFDPADPGCIGASGKVHCNDADLNADGLNTSADAQMLISQFQTCFPLGS